ncbi:hypothetical protein HYH03_016975 [Edaphochlamys debaryana]|uniref:Endonuclease/exonuclease/phosphatase domain-containing protein n=1 Tax=Edaphochlamys debaryana TaxID=47281 RepID=A0A836BPM3_9CHLO|nr:hypothetical protein HYH03_016975 [Edaphochlamys debaryana]|eukprot:KAG2484240.1 hypothetical protein HYH03_016975 [Edaphochlamys debaryana]
MSAVQEGAAAMAAAPAAGAVAAAPPAKAYVRLPPGSDTLVVSVTLGAKTSNLNRPLDEPLDKALARLSKNLTVKPAKKEKRKKGGAAGGSVSGADTSTDEPGAPLAVLYGDVEGRSPLDRSLPNGSAWPAAALLEVAGERFLVEVNPPTVDRLSIDRLAMVGYPTAAAVQLSFADPDACAWRWSAQRPGSTEWYDLGCTTQYYTPCAADEGSVLRVECVPGAWRARGGEGGEGSRELWAGEAVAGVTGPVQHGPERCSASVRCSHTPGPLAAPRQFRIMSYNILADQYAGSDYARNVLFNYCPPANLEPTYRRALVLRELLGYHADVVCLQEVDERAFSDFLTLHMGLQGYSGHYTNKMGRVKEGSATFWRSDRYTALAHHDMRLRDAFLRQPASAPAPDASASASGSGSGPASSGIRSVLPALHAQFAPLLDASPELERALQQVTTIAQATLLAPKNPAPGEGCLLVVNTHLFFHPYAPHIRNVHTAAILEEAAAFLERCAASADPAVAGPLAAAGPGPLGRPCVLFVGDLNSDLNDGIPGVVELLRRGRLPADYWDWVMGAAFKWGMGEEDADTMASETAKISAACAAAQAATGTGTGTATATATSSNDPAGPAPSGAAAGAGAAPSPEAAAAGSLFAADGHAFESAAASPSRPIPVTGIDITLPYTLRSADDLKTPYTNYTSGYKALLDYVWYEEQALRVVGAVPIPSEAEIGSFIPSPSFPSDHLAVVYDMEWRAPEEAAGGAAQ